MIARPPAVTARYRDLLDRLPLRASIDDIAREAKAEVEWCTVWPRGFGKGSMGATQAGFWIKIPAAASKREKRETFGHEIGHTLFYDTSAIVLTNDAQLRRRLRCVPLRKDVWVADPKDEEAICDEIAANLIANVGAF